MPKQTSVQLIVSTQRQVNKLISLGWENFTNIVRIAIDRMYRDEIRRKLMARREPIRARRE